jgi:hypothetical protein
MGAKQIGLRHTGFVEGGREYTDHIAALQTEIALMKGLNHVNIGESRLGREFLNVWDCWGDNGGDGRCRTTC